MNLPPQFVTPEYSFWITILALSLCVLLIWMAVYLWTRLRRNKRLTWDVHTEYIDTAEFSNRNIPLRVIYKGHEPRWLWAAYLVLRNSGMVDINAADIPERQQFVAGKEGCRYIGFNKLISGKAKVALSPLFRGDDVFCKIEFDRLGPGDEILLSLLFIAEEKKRIELQGNLFGASSQVVSGYRQRIQAWRGLWWLLICMVFVGTLGGWLVYLQSAYGGGFILYQFLILIVIYLMALVTSAVLLRPIRYWQQILERFGERPPIGSYGWKWIRFMLGLSDEP